MLPGMPELPEVEARRRVAHDHLTGRRLIGVAAADDRIVFKGAAPTTFVRKLRGRQVVATGRRGKQMWLELDRAPHPVLHFGMGGDFHVYREISERPRFWKLELRTGNGTRVAMTNARRIGRIRLVEDILRDPPVGKLGPDPYLELPALSWFRERFSGRRGPVKAVLLDQTFLAGIGNWIADEVLYQAALDPRRPAASLEAAEVRLLRGKIRSVLARAVAVNADDARFPRTWLFHHRWGRKQDARTARGEMIAFMTVGGRTTAWVPARQT